MKIQDVIVMLNQMERDGVIERYAFGGAVAATFYLEPVSTLDVVVFIALKPEPEKIMVSLAPIFEYLKKFGCQMDGEHIVISGWPVQFLPVAGSLLEEALASAAEVDVEGKRARVPKPRLLIFQTVGTKRQRRGLTYSLGQRPRNLRPQFTSANGAEARRAEGIKPGVMRSRTPGGRLSILNKPLERGGGTDERPSFPASDHLPFSILHPPSSLRKPRSILNSLSSLSLRESIIAPLSPSPPTDGVAVVTSIFHPRRGTTGMAFRPWTP